MTNETTTTSPSAGAKPREHEITITVHEHPKGTLFLREVVAEGQFGDEGTAKVAVEFAVNAGGGWLVRLANGPFFSLDFESIVRALADREA